MTAPHHQHQALLIFVKNPRHSRAKPQIARELGEEKALEIHQCLLDGTRRATEKLPFQKFLLYADFVEETDAWNGKFFNKQVQHGADPGERMATAFRQVLAQPEITRAVLIGCDCPELSGQLITKAFLALETHDFVVGPTPAGGYYLLGMKQVQEEIFEKKHWGLTSVLPDTLTDLRRLKQSFYLLPTLRAVETAADLPAEVLDQITGYKG
jgi:rSAM/selenodomain-associated transferase 1